MIGFDGINGPGLHAAKAGDHRAIAVIGVGLFGQGADRQVIGIANELVGEMADGAAVGFGEVPEFALNRRSRPAWA